MKFRHALYPQPQINTNHGEARFFEYVFETEDRDVAAELAANPEIELVEGSLEEEPKPKTRRKPRKPKAE